MFRKSKGKYWYKSGDNKRGFDLCSCGNFKTPISKMCQACCKGKINIKEKNAMWKGNKVKYRALHDYIKYHKPKPKQCESCGKEKKLELSNISQEYKRDISDYEWICRKCHMIKDERLTKLHKHNRKVTLKTIKKIKELRFIDKKQYKEIAKILGINKDTAWAYANNYKKIEATQ